MDFFETFCTALFSFGVGYLVRSIEAYPLPEPPPPAEDEETANTGL